MGEDAEHEPRESSLASGWTVEPDRADAASVATASTEKHADDALAAAQVTGQVNEGPVATSNLALVLFGVFGGLYLLYTWVWISWAQYYSGVNEITAAGSGSIGGVLQQIVFWVAPAAPAVWFLSALVMNRGRTGRLAVVLLVGAIVLVPIPMFVTSGAAL